MPPKSSIWEHFEKCSDGKVKCKLCYKRFSASGGHTTLKYHVEKIHGFNVDKPINNHEQVIDLTCRDASGRLVSSSSVKAKTAGHISNQGPSTMTQWLNTNRHCSQTRAQELTKLVVNCVVKDLLPLNFCENEGMRTMIMFMEPEYQPPSHSTVKAHLMKIYDDKRQSLMTDLAGSEVSITVDAWTNSQMVGFFSVVAHQVTDEWQLKCYNLASPDINGAHTSDQLASVIDKTLDEWELSCFVCIHDTAANMNSALRKAKKVTYDYGCMAHILQLSIKDSFKNQGKINAMVQKVRDIITDARKSEKFSTLIRKFRDQILSEKTKRELQRDVQTRWNSTLLMLESFVDLHPAVDLAAKDLYSKDKVTAAKMFFSPAEMDLLRDVISVLKLLKVTTDTWEGDQYVTSSTVYPVIFKVVETMRHSFKFESEAENLKEDLISNIEERLSMKDNEFLAEMSIPMIASFLDPRFKKLLFVPSFVRDGIKSTVLNELNKITDEKNITIQKTIETEPPKKKSRLELLFGEGTDAHELEEPSDEMLEYERLKVSAIDTNPLEWWREHEKMFPNLSKLARRYFGTCATSASSERLFSSYGLVYDQRRMSLTKETANAILFLHENDNNPC